MAQYLTPSVKKLLKEFLTENPRQNDDEARNRWSARDDLAQAMRPYIEGVDDQQIARGRWMDDAMFVFPDALFWQFTMFRGCARQALRRLQIKEQAMQEAQLEALPTYGMF